MGKSRLGHMCRPKECAALKGVGEIVASLKEQLAEKDKEIEAWITGKTTKHPRFDEWTAWYYSLGAAKRFDDQLSFRDWCLKKIRDEGTDNEQEG